jgi:hypothetical protein
VEAERGPQLGVERGAGVLVGRFELEDAGAARPVDVPDQAHALGALRGDGAAGGHRGGQLAAENLAERAADQLGRVAPEEALDAGAHLPDAEVGLAEREQHSVRLHRARHVDRLEVAGGEVEAVRGPGPVAPGVAHGADGSSWASQRDSDSKVARADRTISAARPGAAPTASIQPRRGAPRAGRETHGARAAPPARWPG